MQIIKRVAFTAMLFAAASANAGPLVSATYSQIIQGVPIVVTNTSATGTLVGNNFSLDAGSWFATAFCIVSPGVSSCPSGTIVPPPVKVSNLPIPFTAPVVAINVFFNNNGAVNGTIADPTQSITPAVGVTGNVLVIGKIGKAPAFTLLPIVVNAGTGGNVTIPSPGSPYFPSASLKVYLGGDVWHLGAVTQTGLTDMAAAIPDVMATGNVSITSMSGMQYTHVNLVSLGRTKVRGLATSDTSAPSFLRLVYDTTVPEPGTLALLGAGIVGLVAIGRRKLS